MNEPRDNPSGTAPPAEQGPTIILQVADPQRPSGAPIGAILAWVTVALIVLCGIGTGAYFFGRSNGEGLKGARDAGTRQGRVVGQRTGRRLGQAEATRRSYRVAYRAEYRRAFQKSYDEAAGR